MSASEVHIAGIAFPACACLATCGDVPEEDGVCKGLPRPPEPPLVEIVLTRRVLPKEEA